jgi:hypothetical protein
MTPTLRVLYFIGSYGPAIMGTRATRRLSLH